MQPYPMNPNELQVQGPTHCARTCTFHADRVQPFGKPMDPMGSFLGGVTSTRSEREPVVFSLGLQVPSKKVLGVGSESPGTF